MPDLRFGPLFKESNKSGKYFFCSSFYVETRVDV